MRDQPTNKLVMNPEELAEALGLSIWTVYSEISKVRRTNKPNDKIPPFFYIGKLPRFYREDVLQWLRTRQKIGTAEPAIRN